MIRREPLPPVPIFVNGILVGYLVTRTEGYEARTAGGEPLGRFNSRTAAVAALAERMQPCGWCEG